MREIGVRARAFAEGDGSWSARADELERLYDELVRGRRPVDVELVVGEPRAASPATANGADGDAGRARRVARRSRCPGGGAARAGAARRLQRCAAGGTTRRVTHQGAPIDLRRAAEVPTSARSIRPGLARSRRSTGSSRRDRADGDLVAVRDRGSPDRSSEPAAARAQLPGATRSPSREQHASRRRTRAGVAAERRVVPDDHVGVLLALRGGSQRT